MIKKLRLCFLFLIVIALSGCSAEYNITIKNDLKMDEEITILNQNNKIQSLCPTIESCIENYTNYLDDQGFANNRKTEKIDGITESGVKATYTYDSFNDFKKNNILIGQFYNNMNMTTVGNLVTLKFDSITSNYKIFVSDDELEALLTDFTLKIKVPYQVTDNNADNYNKLTNTYSWHYDNSTINKNVNLTFDKSRTFKVNIFDKISDLFKKGKLNGIIIIGSIIVILGSVVVLFAMRNAKSNKI